MAAPNLLTLTTAYGRTTGTTATVGGLTFLANGTGSNRVYKINTVVLVNVSGSSATVAVQYSLGGTTLYEAFNATVAAGATLSVITKETPIYLQEGDSLGVVASAANAIEVIASYEDLG